MMFRLFPLFAITANFVVIAEKVEFPVKLLQPDLNAISQYYKNIEKEIKAYIHWPDSTVFSVCVYEDPGQEQYVLVEGIFERSKKMTANRFYDGLYFKDDKFYVMKKRSNTLKEIPQDRRLRYEKPSQVARTKPFLVIQYASLEELHPKIVRFYNQARHHFDTVLHQYPATFLVTYGNNEIHFLEYTNLGRNNVNTKAQGGLRVILMEEKSNKLRLSESTHSSRLVFDQRNNKLIIPTTSQIESQPYEHVFGVRMDTIGFVANVTDFGVDMLNRVDLIYRDVPFILPVFFDLLRQKIKTLEPRNSYPGLNFEMLYVPQMVKFQLDGLVFVKKMNIRNGRINLECPFLIEREFIATICKIDGKKVYSICANDENVWLPTQTNMIEIN